MAHNRKLVLSGVALTKARLPARQNAAAANRVRDDLEREIIQSEYLEGAPFKWIGLIVRYGLVDESEPHYKKIDPKDGELPIAIEIDTHRLLQISEEQMTNVYRNVALTVLVHIGEKYGLKVDRMRILLATT